MSVPKLDLDHKYTAQTGRIFLTGTQALVRLPLAQVRRDRARGLKTGGFISGYRGSPLGGYDQQLMLAKRHLQAHDVVFQPGVNEELAATAVWGTQQLGLSPGAKFQGVFGIWYGKGPGVDRCGDVFKHANAAGASAYGGVLCVAGDDHGAKSSTIPHQSDHAFMAALIPMLYPSSIHEFVELGLLGTAMSRYSGCWVGMKVIADTVETTGTVDVACEAREFAIPTDFEMPPGGLNLRWPDDRWTQDARLQNLKPFAAHAFARANGVDRVTLDSPNARFGIVASGKAYEDAREALRELDMDEALARRIGLRMLKVGMPWPLEPERVRQFSLGLEEILIVEERREIIENQIKQQLFNWRADVRPRIVGKLDDKDRHVLSLNEELTPPVVARVLAERLLRLELASDIRAHLEGKVREFTESEKRLARLSSQVKRMPYFCSGCPHNTSTRVPEGSRALAGIGCHFMVTWMDRRTETFTHMGGEGVPWTGVAPFTREDHVFVNIGDGTYFHSGQLAIRQAVTSGANVTYKVLYNDAVAMTGGQRVDGDLSPQKIAHQLHLEGVQPIYLVSERPELYSPHDLPPGTVIAHRDALDEVMDFLRGVPGCSAIVYEQTCAAEKRRRRKRGQMADPDVRVVINPLVCEGCGDCSVQSNCVSIEPLETEFGRKRTINQSNCNKDTSCLKGFCPSFVTLKGARLKKREVGFDFDHAELPEPSAVPTLVRPYNIAITGVGGTGVLTVGAILGMAAHLEGKASMILDMTGLAQKGGAVLSHVRIAADSEAIAAPRIVAGAADLLIAADAIVAASKEGAALCSPSRTRGVVNTQLTPVADFIGSRDFDFHERETAAIVRRELLAEPAPDFYNFSAAAETLLGDAIGANIMMLGFAYQKGAIPLSAQAILQAIALNAVAVNVNTKAFNLGRLMAADPSRVEAAIAPAPRAKTLKEMSVGEIVDHRARFLAEYQSEALSTKYKAQVARVAAAERCVHRGEDLARAVAINYAKLLAIKDEYEVARLFTNGAFAEELKAHFEDGFAMSFHLAPPFLARLGKDGRPIKRRFGPWMLPVLRVLARLKSLRETRFDLFGRTAERREERRLIAEYEALIDEVLAGLREDNVSIALALLSLPWDIRGFGPVKAAAIAAARARKDELLALYHGCPAETPLPAAAQ